jgi:UDP-N-acetylmuramoyl-tripeptide--D-alanyl-D-alanine ligase
MVELGDKSKEYNTAFGAQAAEVCDYMILVGSVNSADIKKGAVDAGFDPEKIFIKNTFTEASALMYELDAGREKVILLENDLPDNYK